MSNMTFVVVRTFVTAGSAARVNNRSIAASSPVTVSLRCTARSRERGAAYGPPAIPAGARGVARNRISIKAQGMRGIAD